MSLSQIPASCAVVSRGEAAAQYAKKHQVSLAAAARHFGVSRERARQKWRTLFGTEALPAVKDRAARAKTIATLASQGLAAFEIAATLGTSRDNVCRVLASLGLEAVRRDDKVAVTRETRAKILELAASGRSRAEIAHEAGVTYSVVTKYLAGSSTRGRRQHRGRSAMASEVMDATGCSLHQAAARFVVSPPALFAYRKRRGLRTTLRREDEEALRLVPQESLPRQPSRRMEQGD